MATPIRAQDSEQFKIVQQLLAVDGLHVAINSADRRKLGDYARELARELAGRYGLQVEAYQPGQLERLVADLMLHRFDGALSGISAGSGAGRSRAGAKPAACVLFIPDAQAVRLREFSQLAKLAAGVRQLRLVVMFSGAMPIERDARLHALEARLARWDLDDEDARARSATPAPHEPVPLPTRSKRSARVPQPMRASPSQLASRARPWLAAAAAAVVATAATSAALLIALGPAPTWPSRPASMATPLRTPAPVRLPSLQLAGEPVSAFRRAPETVGTADSRTAPGPGTAAPDDAATAPAALADAPQRSER